MNLSIVIPTRDRATTLSICLSHLIPQLNISDEIIVIDNGTDTTESTVRAISDSRIRYLRVPYQANASRARNDGFHLAKNPIVCFLDDDSFVSSGWAKAVRHAITRNQKKHVLFQGKVVQRYQTIGPIERQKYLNFSRDAAFQGMGTGTHQKSRVTMILAGNVFGLRSLFKQLKGPFDDKRFPFIGEQVDLTYRCFQQGIDVLYIPDATVYHTKLRVRLSDDIKSAFGYGRAMKQIEKIYLSDPRVLLAIGSVLPASKSLPVPDMISEPYSDRLLRALYRMIISGSYRFGYGISRI